jgi:tRNA A37 threonylcarbamoyladenosine dehydratase
MDWQERSRRLLGENSNKRLEQARILVCGLGGVGSFVAEALVRSGVGALDLLDFDIVAPSNLNRQLPATQQTIGQYKTDVLEKRFKEINPAIKITNHKSRLTKSTIPVLFEQNSYSYVADAIDDLPAKTSLISYALHNQIPIISAMGAAFRLDPSHLQISDIAKTHTCPLSRRLRRALKEEGISQGLDVVWSDEIPISPKIEGQGPASMIFVPASAGLLMASFIVRKITEGK